MAFESCPGELDFFLREEKSVGFIRCPGPEDISNECQGKSDDRGDDEHPAPTSEPVDAIKMFGSGGLEKAGSESTKSEADVEDTSSAANLVAFVPRSQNKMDTGEVGSLSLSAIPKTNRARNLLQRWKP